MIFVVLIAVLFILAAVPVARCAARHPLALAYNGPVDLYRFITRRERDNCPTGELVAFVGLFGKGKTLSAVHKVVGMYERYDGRMVYCQRRNRLVRQRIKVLSNVSLAIPYEDFVSLEQIILCAERNSAYDDEHDTLTVTLVLGDEFSVQMNSRSFKTNIDPLFLNTLLTCRHYHISLYYTSQRFGHVDALLRQVTSYVVDCKKLWRFQRQDFYDAWELENATSTQLLTPTARGCWFVKDKDYNAYNTLACVGNLKKSVQKGDMMSADEILKLQMNSEVPNMEGIAKPSKRWMRSKKQQSKK